MVNCAYFPRNTPITSLGKLVVESFETVADRIRSDQHNLKSDEVLAVCRDGLVEIGFEVESGKKADQKIAVPVLFGKDGKIEKSFNVDAYHQDQGFVLEIEAGRGVDNHQFLKDLFQACVMVNVDYLGIAVRIQYRNLKNFDQVYRFIDTLYTSGRLSLPLKGILLVGY